MGEIKSTLDLVMARTKHLTMTDEEKKAHQSEKIKQYLQGLIQKFQDQVVNLTQFEDAVEKYKKDSGGDVQTPLTEMLLHRIDLTADNAALLSLLEHVCRVDITLINKSIGSFQHSVNELRQTREKALRAHFSDTFHVAGSAVIPNLAKDEIWQSDYQRLMEAHQLNLENQCQRLRSI